MTTPLPFASAEIRENDGPTGVPLFDMAVLAVNHRQAGGFAQLAAATPRVLFVVQKMLLGSLGLLSGEAVPPVPFAPHCAATTMRWISRRTEATPKERKSIRSCTA